MSDTTTADTATDTTTTSDTTTDTGAAGADTATDTPDPTALAADVEKWKTLARKHEDKAKANADAAKELDRIKREALPEQERLVAEAEARGSAAAAAKFAARIVDAEVRAAAAGRNVDVDALLEGLDRTRFLTDDGEPDTAAITAWVDRIAPSSTTTDATATTVFDLGQGARTNSAEALNGDPLLAGIKKSLGLG